MKTLYSKAPKHLPELAFILAATIGGNNPDAVAAHLDVSSATVKRWIKAGEAPRAAMLALFWETRFGQAVVDCEAVNQARTHAGLNRALKEENASLRARIARLEALGGGFGAANEPFLLAARH